MTPIDADRTLALSYVPANVRPALAALWHLDAALGAALTGSRETLINRIKLAWWREALVKLDEAPAPNEPVLKAVAAHLLVAGVAGHELAEMEEGWTVLLEEENLSEEDLARYAQARGARLFRLSARLLGGAQGVHVDRAGEAWSLVDLARHSGATDATLAMNAAGERKIPALWPRNLRPLGMLAMLARRDLKQFSGQWEIQGSPGRMLRMLGHRITGR